MKKTILALAALTLISQANAQGKVGINTIYPQTVLHVDGAKDNTSATDNDPNHQLNDVTVTKDGFIGIGTANPGGRLHVINSFPNLQGNINDIIFENYQNIGQWPALIQKYGRGTKQSPSALQNGDQIGGIEVHGITSNGGEKILGYLRGEYNNNTNNNMIWDLMNNTGGLRINEVGKICLGNVSAFSDPNQFKEAVNIVGTLKTDNIVLPNIPIYPSDAAADADINLPKGALYQTSASRQVFKKPL